VKIKEAVEGNARITNRSRDAIQRDISNLNQKLDTIIDLLTKKKGIFK
tara:strand:- start:126 stop:269 length:144 start_codon:yes stop_codon:yes gene_type:complete